MITSASNARLKAIRRLGRSKGADRTEMLLEGPHLIAAALEAGCQLLDVLVTPELADSQPELLARLGQPAAEVSAELLERMADSDSPRGILARAKAPRTGIDDLDPSDRGPVVYADRLQDPGNLGALARVIEATRAHSLILGPGCVHAFHPRALRSSAGSLLRLRIATRVAPEDLARWSQSRPWVALVPRDGESLYRTEIPGDALLLLGSEGSGLGRELLARSALHLTVPLSGAVESLNVAVAAGVVLFELRRRQDSGHQAASGRR